MVNEILMSVDMDEWYQCRWATGSEFARWHDTRQFFKEYYGTGKPIGEIIPLTERILDLFSAYSIKATFFFTGEIASYYPDLVRYVRKCGHEIGSHNYVHKDYGSDNSEEFRDDLRKSKELLEDLSGSEVVGYRAPNSTLSDYMIEDLLKLGFKYDSSVTPTRSIMGKFGDFTNTPVNPYMLSGNDFALPGNSGLWEFPWPVLPFLKLPSGSGITTRLAGYIYTIIALDHALKTGDSVYYFHPYEIGSRPNVEGLDLRTRVFLRNLGENYYRILERLIKRYNGRFTCGKMLLDKHSAET
jgi:peptidoglycan/xylan/chitin deacetylase (PgdA/CDA1 family)